MSQKLYFLSYVMIHFCYCVSCHIAEDFVDNFANKYLEEVANGTHNKEGWPNWAKLG
jgi:hypothetical protein